ncbi:MAG: sigma-54 dependent transcriptional regulator [Bacteroidales bacterium]|nr:sigma-54 dependent transcriptional regulator [Bacteroidales bacterium]
MDIQNIKNRYDIIGNDAKLIFAINKAAQVAPTDLSILVTGESGVGKDVFSRIIHDNSTRKHKKLVAVNCGAIPEGTIESELFGHIKGSFTGAERDRKGYFEEADQGTIFLDEVGELPLAMQVKLLRVLENGEILPVGSSSARKVDVRVVAATNKDILREVHNGHFREDLYYRLNQISIYIPPLRERKDDIYLLFRKFSNDVAEKYSMPPISLTPDARDYLMRYPWYGNIRELKNMTEQIAVVETERLITQPILQNYLKYVPTEKMPAIYVDNERGEGVTDRELLLKALNMGQSINEMRSEINYLRQAVARLAQGTTIKDLNEDEEEYASMPVVMNDVPHVKVLGKPSRSAEQHIDAEGFNEAEVVTDDEPASLQEREKAAIIDVLARNGGKRNKTARDLGISERTLYRKLKEYGLE